jgi:hypothetical protein
MPGNCQATARRELVAGEAGRALANSARGSMPQICPPHTRQVRRAGTNGLYTRGSSAGQLLPCEARFCWATFNPFPPGRHSRAARPPPSGTPPPSVEHALVIHWHSRRCRCPATAAHQSQTTGSPLKRVTPVAGRRPRGPPVASQAPKSPTQRCDDNTRRRPQTIGVLLSHLKIPHEDFRKAIMALDTRALQVPRRSARHPSASTLASVAATYQR